MNNSVTLTPPVSAHDHTEGRDDAPVTLLEFGDYQCPYCGNAHAVIKQLQEALGKNLRFAFRNYPLSQVHPYALMAAQTAEAAARQGKFWEVHDFIFENQQFLEPEVLPSWAKDLGLNMKEFAADIRQGHGNKKIEDDRASGIHSGVNGTPCFFINGMRYDGEGDYDSLRAALAGEEALRRAR